MKTNCQNEFLFEELSQVEIENIQGGWIQFLAGLIVGGMISDWPGFKSGFVAGFKAATN